MVVAISQISLFQSYLGITNSEGVNLIEINRRSWCVIKCSKEVLARFVKHQASLSFKNVSIKINHFDVKLHLQVLISGILRASLNINFNTNGNAENCREDGDDSTLLEPTLGEPVLKTTKLVNSKQKKLFVLEK